MKLTFLGAADGVTGSRHLVDTGERQILLDCGLFQGFKQQRERNWFWPEALRGLDAVVLSHAHLDHSGWLPVLAKQGFRGRVHATPATRRRFLCARAGRCRRCCAVPNSSASAVFALTVPRSARICAHQNALLGLPRRQRIRMRR